MTVSNYLQLNELAQKYPTLVILGFPCAQFLNQEPGKNDEILNCLKFVRPGSGYVPDFTLFQKIFVNGPESSMHPLYFFLKGVCPQPSAIVGVLPFVSWSPIATNDITWNFEKFLIDKKGVPYRRYTPETPPLALESDIQQLLRQ